MNKLFKLSTRSVLLIAGLIVLGSCKDTWNEHYSFKETESKYPVAKLAETLGGISEFSNFCKALENTLMCDKHGRPIEDMTYMKLLSDDQFLTVWAPSNSALTDAEWEPYIKKNKTDAENLEVGQKFIENHIARFRHTVGDTVESKVYMLNGKAIRSHSAEIAGNPYHGSDKNIRCSNGVLHGIDGYIKFLPTLYEYVTKSSDYRDLFGKWFESYTVTELDLSRSVSLGQKNENDEIIYVDSVMMESNILLNRFGRIQSEDSLYYMVIPTPQLWSEQFDRISKYFKYGEKELNNDSLMLYYTRTTMITDMFFNMNPSVQHYWPDSVISTRYSRIENRTDDRPYHVFGAPTDKTNGIFGSAVDSVECSNGMIYIVDKWPFVDTLTFLRHIKYEAEDVTLKDFLQPLQSINKIGNKTLDKTAQVRRFSREGRSDWDAKFYIGNNLRGKYAIKIVLAPDLDHKRPNFLHPIVKYDSPTYPDSTLIDSISLEVVDFDGWEFEMEVPYYMINDTSKIDTMLVGIVDLPSCKYDMTNEALRLTLQSGVIDDNAHMYSSEMWLDCIILEPVVE